MHLTWKDITWNSTCRALQSSSSFTGWVGVGSWAPVEIFRILKSRVRLGILTWEPQSRSQDKSLHVTSLKGSAREARVRGMEQDRRGRIENKQALSGARHTLWSSSTDCLILLDPPLRVHLSCCLLEKVRTIHLLAPRTHWWTLHPMYLNSPIHTPKGAHWVLWHLTAQRLQVSPRAGGERRTVWIGVEVWQPLRWPAKEDGHKDLRWCTRNVWYGRWTLPFYQRENYNPEVEKALPSVLQLVNGKMLHIRLSSQCSSIPLCITA